MNTQSKLEKLESICAESSRNPLFEPTESVLLSMLIDATGILREQENRLAEAERKIADMQRNWPKIVGIR